MCVLFLSVFALRFLNNRGSRTKKMDGILLYRLDTVQDGSVISAAE